MLDLYLIRHAESVANKYQDEFIHGSANEIELSEDGPLQAMKLGNRILKEKLVFDEIYSSIAVRAYKTCEIVCNLINHPLEKILVSEELVELSKGKWKGCRREKIIKIYENSEDKWTLVPPNGESFEMASNRMHNFLKNNELYKKSNNNRKIAIFTHGNAIRSFLKPVMGIDSNILHTLEIENTAITNLIYENEKWEIKKINDYEHLKP